MKSIFKVFGGYKKMMASIAQIILAVIILPILCRILSWLVGSNDALDIVSNILGELAITEYWLGVLMTHLQTPANISGLDVYVNSIEYANSAIFETCIFGMSIGLCKNIGIILGIRGVPLIQSIFGVFLGGIVVSVCDMSNETTTLFYCAGLIIFNAIVIWLMPGGELLKKVLATLIGLGLQMLIAVLSVGYIMYLTLIMRGVITELPVAVAYLCAIFLPLLIVLLVDYFLLTPDKD